MRWLFADESNPVEVAQRQRKLEDIDAWWTEFRRRTDDLKQLFLARSEWDLPAWMNEFLKPIDENLMWEFGPGTAPGKSHRLVITPESALYLRPLVDVIMQRAPEIPSWEFFDHRIAEDVDMVQPTLEARVGRAVDGLEAVVSVGELQLMNVGIIIPNYPQDENIAFAIACITTEVLLGERRMEKWVGGIRPVNPANQAPAGRSIPLDRLRDTFESVVDSMTDQLPREPIRVSDDDQWSLLRTEPEEASDYPHRRDIITIVTARPDIAQATAVEGVFFSERFSNCGEKFCYLKCDGDDSESEMMFSDREEMEQATQAALSSTGAGCVFGGATGLRYSYVDFTLSDLENGIAAVRACWQAAKAPRRTWILFHDAYWGHEWVGIYDDTPPPPAE